MDDRLNFISRMGRPRILVLGDLILDRYTWGDAERVSPEAPVLVLRADAQEVRPGGAASVALLARGLDAQVSIAGVLGDDAAGEVVNELLDEAGIKRELVLDDPNRPTTVKQRFIGRAASRHPHQILRVDREQREPLDPELEKRLSESIVACLDRHQAVLVSDYNKGVCTPGLLATLIEAATAAGVPIIVDPARVADYTRYRGATILTPNRTEAELATGRKIPTPEAALDAAEQLRGECRAAAVLVTLDSQGMALVHKDQPAELASTKARSVYDITGAGDMVLATIGLCLASGIPLSQAVCLANLAAGLEVERLGVAPVSRGQIQAELTHTEHSGADKLVSVERMALLADSYRRSGKTIVLTNGCFDLLHVGHAAYLAEAATLGDLLVVAVNSDASVRRAKGPDRPVIGQHDRAALLAALSSVDHVLIFDADTPHELLRQIRPDVLVKGGTYTREEVVGREVVEAYGGKVCVTGKVEGASTSRILSSARAALPP